MPRNFASYVLRSYYKATGWNDDNLFTNLTRSSDAILDFRVPEGINLAMSKSPNSMFKTSYSMNAIPTLNGSVGYIFTSCDLDVESSGHVRVKDVVERFGVGQLPIRPTGKYEEEEETWLAGERIDTIFKRDYLMYGRLYMPSGRLDALYSMRLSPTLQGVVAAISDFPSKLSPGNDPSNIMFNLQHDIGKWCTEYSYSAEDSMWGVKVLHNFGRSVPADSVKNESVLKRIDEEEPIEGGLRGRFSAGAELYVSAQERSAGVSTGIRFATYPPSTSPSPSPPTTITALFNPMLGHLSSAYSARVSRDLALSSRFDFNVYSIESEWAMGAEWLLRDTETENGSVYGLVKARASTNNDVSLLWEGRIRNIFVSLGLMSDLSNRSKPIKAMGLELSYFSSE